MNLSKDTGQAERAEARAPGGNRPGSHFRRCANARPNASSASLCG